MSNDATLRMSTIRNHYAVNCFFCCRGCLADQSNKESRCPTQWWRSLRSFVNRQHIFVGELLICDVDNNKTQRDLCELNFHFSLSHEKTFFSSEFNFRATPMAVLSARGDRSPCQLILFRETVSSHPFCFAMALGFVFFFSFSILWWCAILLGKCDMRVECNQAKVFLEGWKNELPTSLWNCVCHLRPKKRERYGVLFVHVDGKYGKEGGNGLKCPISIRNTNVSG